MSPSGHDETILPKLGLFFQKLLLLFTECWISCVMPGLHVIILTDASVEFFPECVSCAFATTKCLVLRGMERTTSLKMIPFFEFIFYFGALFSITNFDLSNYVLKTSVCSKIGSDFSFGHHVSLSEVNVVDCKTHSIVVRLAFKKMHSAQSSGIGYMLFWCVLQLKVEVHQSHMVSCDSSCCRFRPFFLQCKEMSECFLVCM